MGNNRFLHKYARCVYSMLIFTNDNILSEPRATALRPATNPSGSRMVALALYRNRERSATVQSPYDAVTNGRIREDSFPVQLEHHRVRCRGY
jgi:hypothetical protein